jgi:hypothetical protein
VFASGCAATVECAGNRQPLDSAERNGRRGPPSTPLSTLARNPFAMSSRQRGPNVGPRRRCSSPSIAGGPIRPRACVAWQLPPNEACEEKTRNGRRACHDPVGDHNEDVHRVLPVTPSEGCGDLSLHPTGSVPATFRPHKSVEFSTQISDPGSFPQRAMAPTRSAAGRSRVTSSGGHRRFEAWGRVPSQCGCR